jgi:NADH-quinone oxidoreductase subunit G
MKAGGGLEPAPWSRAIAAVAAKFKEVGGRRGTFGVIGSNHTTNEENRYLGEFARGVLGTENIDHHRTGDVLTLLDALGGQPGRLAVTEDLYTTPAVLIVGADLAMEHPFLSWQVRANARHHGAHVYVATVAPVREDNYAASVTRGLDYTLFRDRLAAEAGLVILYGDAVKGDGVRALVRFGESLGIPVKYVPLVDYSNSRGALDMGLVPGPGGLALTEMLSAGLDVLWVVGANPLARAAWAAGRAPGFLVVQDLFLTETARLADIVLPAASAYEKEGTVTNVCGEVQKLKKAAAVMGPKPDLEIFELIAREMGAVPPPAGKANAPADARPDLVWSAHNDLFSSGTLGRYSKVLNSVPEKKS